MKKKIAILGSTGSIGRQTLAVVDHLQEDVEVVALAAHSNIERLETQAVKYRPQLVAVYDKEQALELKKRLPQLNVVAGAEGLIAAATTREVNFVVSALVGAAGIVPTYRAIEAGKDIGLANKEILIAAGEMMIRCAREKQVALLPIDSEHSALFQCLQKEKIDQVRRMILTASGGPFFRVPIKNLGQVTVSDALRHPNWSMGKKITIDSSTLMNKGFEVIEAYYLFGLPVDQIEVVMHPQSLVHGFIECVDGSLLAQLAEPDMKLPIQYALTYPKRKQGILPRFDFQKHPKLEFFPPDLEKFPCLQLAYHAIKEGGTLPCFMNGANEVLVSRFLASEIAWLDIGKKLERLMSAHQTAKVADLETLFAVDAEARLQAQHI
ncbi:MAG: 1-deoxy-D-xylulose-5-phosphate reductoisomerase [Chlamydiota bacterium]